MDIEDLNFKLLFKRPIDIQNSCILFQPMIKEIIDYGFEKYSLLLSPYQADINMLEIKDENKNKFKNFDLFFLVTHDGEFLFKTNNKNMIDLLCESLKFYFKTDNVYIYNKEMCVIINDLYALNRDNFDDFASLIFAINKTTKPKFEKPPVLQNERQKDVYEKLMKGRMRNLKKCSTNYESIINAVIHGGDYFIPYEYIEKMTIYQLVNSYESIVNKDWYNKNFSQYLAGAEPDKLDLTHWSEKLKII